MYPGMQAAMPNDADDHSWGFPSTLSEGTKNLYQSVHDRLDISTHFETLLNT